MLTPRSSEVCYRSEVILNIKSDTVMAVTSLIYKKVKLYSPHFSYHVRNNYFNKKRLLQSKGCHECNKVSVL